VATSAEEHQAGVISAVHRGRNAARTRRSIR
jgi:hypothetical protein